MFSQVLGAALTVHTRVKSADTRNFSLVLEIAEILAAIEVPVVAVPTSLGAPAWAAEA
jgi:hypothetical protein